MTIAAGFQCRGGVVLAADTEITNVGGTGKSYESKIFHINESLGSCLTYSGNPDFAKELVEELQNVSKGQPGDEALASIKKTYLEFYRKHYTIPPKNEKSWAELLLTIRQGKRISLYMARGHHITRVRKYQVLGIGQEQSETLVSPLYSSMMTTNQAAYMAVYVLRRVKGFVQGCGGDSETEEIEDVGDAISFLSCGLQGINDIEQDFDFLDTQMKPMVLSFSDPRIDQKTFQNLIKVFGNNVKQYRAQRFRKQEKEIRDWKAALEAYK
jgi:hypothetical protein